MKDNNSTEFSIGNDSSNANSYLKLRKSVSIFSATGLCLVFIVGVLGNGVVIWLTGFKMKKTVKTVWFLNLAVADFLLTALLPLNVTYIALDFHWPFGNFMCKVNNAALFLNMFTSVYILVAISVDRCVTVVWPLWARSHRTVRKASYVSLGVWVLALIYSTPYFIFRDTGPSSSDEETIRCFNNYSPSNNVTQSVSELKMLRRRAMTLTRFFLGFLLPFIVIVSSNAVMIHRLRRNRNVVSRSRRPFKIIAAVIIAFFLCWAPYHILSLIQLLYYTGIRISIYVFIIGFPIAENLAFLNSCINPLLYVFIGQDVKNIVSKSFLNTLTTVLQEEE